MSRSVAPVQQSSLSYLYFNTIAVSPEDGAGAEWLTEETARCATQLLEMHAGEVPILLELLIDERWGGPLEKV